MTKSSAIITTSQRTKSKSSMWILMWTEPEQIFYGCSVVYYCSLLWNVSQVERITKINYSLFWNESCTSQLYSGWNSNYSGLFISYNHLFSLYTWVVILEWVLPLYWYFSIEFEEQGYSLPLSTASSWCLWVVGLVICLVFSSRDILMYSLTHDNYCTWNDK